jgi:hypothetical protein
MRIPWRAREYERTCGDCGYVWMVPRWAVHSPTELADPQQQLAPAAAVIGHRLGAVGGQFGGEPVSALGGKRFVERQPGA